MKTRERVQVDLELIDDNPWQPRQEIDQDELQELADSIHQLGLLQAPLGRRDKIRGRIQLAFGHRRVAGCRLLHQQGRGEPHIDLDVADITNEEMAVLALTENERRKQLSQIEVVRAHKRAIDETALTTQALADQLGIPRPTLANNLRVLDLPDFVLEHVESGALGLTVAREFLVLQSATHEHTEDMRHIVRRIVDLGSGPPDWRRRNVRKITSETVSYNEKDWRPLGPPTAHSTGGGHKEASFDRDDFVWEYRDSLHTIPADDGHIENYHRTERYDKSRQWTCEVKGWSRRQTRATREANRETVASGKAAPASQAKAPSRDQQFEQLLKNDPVWKQITVSRETTGPNRPVTADERQQLGSREEFREVNYDTRFWKILQKGDPQDIGHWQGERGGHVPPYFPDLKECQRCTIGAAYAKSRGGYPLGKPALVCFNQEHYQEKLAVGEAAYREKMEAHQKGLHRQDSASIMQIVSWLQPLPEEACRALALALIAVEPTLEWQHPFGRFHEGWSYESGAAVRVRELLGTAAVERYGRSGRSAVVDIESLQKVAPEDLREVVAAVMTHHLRQSGKIETVSRETPAMEAV